MKSEVADAIATQRLLELRYHDYAKVVEKRAWGQKELGVRSCNHASSLTNKVRSCEATI